MLERASQTGGQPPPTAVLLDYLIQLLRGRGYLPASMISSLSTMIRCSISCLSGSAPSCTAAASAC